MSDEVVNEDGALVVDMAQADALWNSLDPIKRAELTNMMFEPVLAKAKQQATRIEELEKWKRYWSGEIDTILAGRADAEDRIEDLESKLAKAVEALPRWIVAMGDWEQGGEQAIEEMTTTLAELTGGKDE